jgi:hypothetical protein
LRAEHLVCVQRGGGPGLQNANRPSIFQSVGLYLSNAIAVGAGVLRGGVAIQKTQLGRPVTTLAMFSDNKHSLNAGTGAGFDGYLTDNHLEE